MEPNLDEMMNEWTESITNQDEGILCEERGEPTDDGEEVCLKCQFLKKLDYAD